MTTRLSTCISTLLLLLAAAAPAARAQEMMTYQMVFLRPGPNPDVPAGRQKAMQDEHLTRLAELNQKRIAVLYGPFQDSSDLRGIVILDVPTADTAREHLADDPYVKAGHMAIEVRPWYGPRGWFHPPSEPREFERLVFGFLMRGTSTSQSREEAQEIQRGHLAYMDELHKQGKLVAAGPFGDNSDFRGIVIYRVQNLDEARQLAAGDPAVKAGRLRIDARAWMTFKGILK